VTPLASAVAAWRKQPERYRGHAALTLLLYAEMSERAAKSPACDEYWRHFHRDEARALRAAIRLLRAAEKPAGKARRR
jgi:hypothetical protein